MRNPTAPLSLAILLLSVAPPLRGQEVSELFESSGVAAADTVVIFVQGGPFADLRPQLADGLAGISRYHRVTVHQPWTLDPTLLTSPDRVSTSDAERLNAEALDMLDAVVRHFETRARAVCLVGHSYGALLTLAWLATNERPIPVQILAGRLLLPDIVWQNFQAGRLFWFPDGKTPTGLDGPTPEHRLVAMRLQADLGRRRFATLLAGRDLSHVTVVSGERDRLVGAMTPAETAFLTEHGARFVSLDGGDHRSMFEPEYAEAMRGVFRCG